MFCYNSAIVIPFGRTYPYVYAILLIFFTGFYTAPLTSFSSFCPHAKDTTNKVVHPVPLIIFLVFTASLISQPVSITLLNRIGLLKTW